MPDAAYHPPAWPARVIGGRLARWFGPSTVTLLSVRGRSSGAWRSVPVVLLEHDGARYLVAAYGDTEWARNLRAAGGGRLTRRRRPAEAFTAVEVPVAERQPLIDGYLERFGGYPHVRRAFADLPVPADHPVFRVDAP